MAVSQVRQNFHSEVEAAINKQINMELYNSYVYLSMYCYFDRDDVAFPGMTKFLKESSDEERQHAQKLIDYQNRRGGRVVLNPIDKPPKDEWGSPLEAMLCVLELERGNNAALLNLHALATDKNDPQCTDFLEGELLEEQAKDIKKIGDYVTQMKRCGSGLGEHIFDRNLNE